MRQAQEKIRTERLLKKGTHNLDRCPICGLMQRPEELADGKCAILTDPMPSESYPNRRRSYKKMQQLHWVPISGYQEDSDPKPARVYVDGVYESAKITRPVLWGDPLELPGRPDEEQAFYRRAMETNEQGNNRNHGHSPPTRLIKLKVLYDPLDRRNEPAWDPTIVGRSPFPGHKRRRFTLSP